MKKLNFNLAAHALLAIAGISTVVFFLLVALQPMSRHYLSGRALFLSSACEGISGCKGIEIHSDTGLPDSKTEGAVRHAMVLRVKLPAKRNLDEVVARATVEASASADGLLTSLLLHDYRLESMYSKVASPQKRPARGLEDKS